MTASIDDVLVGTLGEANIGLFAGVGALNPLAAQLDAAIAFALGPLQSDLSAALDAALGLQATLALQATDPTAILRSALQAIIELTASLTAALSLPPSIFDLTAELGASVSLSGALTAKLGVISALIEAAISVKIPAVRLAADLSAALNAGDVVLLSFDGLSDPTNLATIGALINAKFSTGIGSGAISPIENVAGIIMVVTSPSVFTSLGAIIQT
jgi:hypothetical protein